jgi:CRP/FNR family transcriptional regulator, cyclic AMP receptor protein
VIETQGILRSYEPNALLWQAGEASQAMHVVLEGEVRVLRSSGGRQRVVHQERRGGTLGDVALFADAPYPATAIAATRVRTIALTRDTLHAVFRADPAFALVLLREVANRVRHLIQRLDHLSSWSVRARVAHHLLERSQSAHGASFTLGVTQQVLAEELGTAREVVVRVLRELRAEGCIEGVGRGRYRLIDLERLRSIARPSE